MFYVVVYCHCSVSCSLMSWFNVMGYVVVHVIVYSHGSMSWFMLWFNIMDNVVVYVMVQCHSSSCGSCYGSLSTIQPNIFNIPPSRTQSW